MAQPDFVLLREAATGRPAPDGKPVHIPMEMVVHFARLFVLLTTGNATPMILEIMRILGEAELRAQASPEDDAARHDVAGVTARLDQLMAAEIAKRNYLENFVTAVPLSCDDDPDEALLDLDP